MKRKRIAQVFGLGTIVAFVVLLLMQGAASRLFYALPGSQSWLYGVCLAFAAEEQVWEFLSIPLGIYGLLSPWLVGAAVLQAMEKGQTSLLKVLLCAELLLTGAFLRESRVEFWELVLTALGGVWDVMALLLLPREQPGTIRWKRWGCALAALAAFCLAIVWLPAALAPDPLTVLSKELEADIRGTILRDADTHGGFHGDGDRVVEIQVDDAARFLDSLEGSPFWHPMPLRANVAAALYDIHAFPVEEPFPGSGMPQVEDGLWFFRDRSSEAEDPASDRDLHSRYSWNFTIAIFDAQTNRLYVLELDT